MDDKDIAERVRRAALIAKVEAIEEERTRRAPSVEYYRTLWRHAEAERERLEDRTLELERLLAANSLDDPYDPILKEAAARMYRHRIAELESRVRELEGGRIVVGK